jgi:hypothetical protein
LYGAEAAVQPAIADNLTTEPPIYLGYWVLTVYEPALTAISQEAVIPHSKEHLAAKAEGAGVKVCAQSTQATQANKIWRIRAGELGNLSLRTPPDG